MVNEGNSYPMTGVYFAVLQSNLPVNRRNRTHIMEVFYAGYGTDVNQVLGENVIVFP